MFWSVRKSRPTQMKNLLAPAPQLGYRYTCVRASIPSSPLPPPRGIFPVRPPSEATRPLPPSWRKEREEASSSPYVRTLTFPLHSLPPPPPSPPLPPPENRHTCVRKRGRRKEASSSTPGRNLPPYVSAKGVGPPGKRSEIKREKISEDFHGRRPWTTARLFFFLFLHISNALFSSPLLTFPTAPPVGVVSHVGGGGCNTLPPPPSKVVL